MFRLLQDKYEGSFQLNHTAPPLRRLGLPTSAALTVSSASHADGSRSFFMNSSAGSQKVDETRKSGGACAPSGMLLNGLNVLQISQEITVTKTPETAGVKGHFRHTVTSLKKLGVPADVSLQVIMSNRIHSMTACSRTLIISDCVRAGGDCFS